jgi:hypothetical protein
MKKTLVSIFVLIAVVVIVGYLYQGYGSKQPQAQVTYKSPKELYNYDSYEKETAVAGFPQSLLITPAKFYQSFSKKLDDGRMQMTALYDSSASLAEAKNMYTKYLNDNGFKIESEEHDGAYSMRGTNGDKLLSVTLKERTLPGEDSPVTNVLLTIVNIQ